MSTPIHDSSHAYAVGRQSDGKLVVAGCSFDSSTSARFAVTRYTPSGTLDTSFGEGGAVSVAFPESTATCETGAFPLGSTADLAIRPDDKIIVVGSVDPEDGPQDFAAIQLTPDGQLDSTFGNGGGILLHPGDTDWHAGARAIMLEPGGRAVIAGEARSVLDDGDRERSSFAAVRIEPDGTLDGSFGIGGEFVQELTENAPVGSDQFSSVADVVRHADGRMALVGAAYDNWTEGDGSYRFRLAAVRLDTNGQIDPSFSGDGKLVTPVRGIDDHTRSVAAALADGGQLTVGLRYDEHLNGGSYAAHPLVARFTEDGDPDPTFGVDGSTLLDFEQSGDPHVSALAYQVDGKLVVAGTGDGNFYFALARLTTTGALDASFGTSGITLGPPFGSDAWNRAWGQDLLLEPSGKIVVAGFATTDTDPVAHFALTRYEGDSPPPPTSAPLPPSTSKPLLSSPGSSPSVGSDRNFTIRAFGDSVTAGFGYNASGRQISRGRLISTCVLFSSSKRCQSPDVTAYPAMWAREVGIPLRRPFFANYAMSGSTPADWIGHSGKYRRRLDRLVSENPDVIVLTLGGNPLLTKLAFGLSGQVCMRTDSTGRQTRRCVRRLLTKYGTVSRLTHIYTHLIKATDATVIVFLYHEAYPETIPRQKVRLLLGELDSAIATAAGNVQDGIAAARGRLILMRPPSFRAHQCKAAKPWVLKIDTCIHPNAVGQRVYARTLAAQVPSGQ